MTQESPAVSLQEGLEGSSATNETISNGSLDLVDEYKKISEPIKHEEVYEIALSTQAEGPEAHEVALSTQTEGLEVLQVCRVCQCADPDRDGVAALKSLGICFPVHASHKITTRQAHCLSGEQDKTITDTNQHVQSDTTKDVQSNFSVPNCKGSLAPGPSFNDSLIELGCACRSDLAFAHYACALRWFVSRDSIVCEICGKPAINVRIADRDKVISTLREKYLLLRSLVNGEASSQSCTTDHATALLSSGSGGAALDAVSWFDPHGCLLSDLPTNVSDPVIDIPEGGRLLNSVSPATKWAVEGTGILIATGLLTVTITWLLAPRVNKGVARKGLNVLLAGLCALAIVVFLRFGVLPRIKYGPARYWAILVVFWFLIFGVWASSTRSTRTST